MNRHLEQGEGAKATVERLTVCNSWRRGKRPPMGGIIDNAPVAFVRSLLRRPEPMELFYSRGKAARGVLLQGGRLV